MTAPLVVWDPRMLGYDLGGDHPLHPLRWELTWALAGRTRGAGRAYQVLAPEPADDETLGPDAHSGYIAAVRAARRTRSSAVGHGLGTADNPVFPRMHEASALVAGGRCRRPRRSRRGEVDRAVNFAGGLHHAMADRASGFCVYNDAALAIAALLDAGGAGSPTSTSTCTTATACRPRSTTTPGC